MPSIGKIFQDVLALISLLGVMAIVLWIHFSQPLLTRSGPLPSSTTKYMVTGITILATLFTQFVSGRIRYLFLRSFETSLRNMPGPQQAVGPLPGQGRSEAIEKLDRKWRGALGIDSLFLEKLKNSKFLSVYLVCGLITTAIVTALTPTIVNRIVPYHPMIPDANYGAYLNGNNHSCVGMADSNFNLTTPYIWGLNNGSIFYGSADLGYCPPAKAMALSTGINTRNPDDYVYVDSGVAVQKTAIGAPAAVYKSLVLQNLYTDYGLSLVNTTQCVPVMQSNPVQCRPAGTLKVLSDNRLYAKSADGMCHNNVSYPRNFTRDSVMNNFMCANYKNATSESIGLATIFFGALNDPTGGHSFAVDLAGTMNDPNETARLPRSTYAVTCTVNPRKSFVYRTVTLDLQAIKKRTYSGYAYYLSGGDPCTPVHETISNVLFATAATANHNLVMEGAGVDYYFSAIHNVAGLNRPAPYAFSNSRNALEDILGLVAALAVSSLQTSGPGYGGNVTADAREGHGGSAYAVAEAARLGTDKLEALLLLIPPFGSFLILGWLFIKNLHQDQGPGAREYKNLLKDERPQLYVAESLSELMRLGRFWGLNGKDARVSGHHIGDRSAHGSEQFLHNPHSEW